MIVIAKFGTKFCMNTTQFNAMHAVATDLLARYHAGAEFDEHTVRWAQALIAGNPTPKRRPTPVADKVLELLADHPEGLTSRVIADTTQVNEKAISSMLRRGDIHKTLSLFPPLYFTSAAAADAYKPPPKPEKPPKIPRLAKTPRPREHVKKPEPIELSPARKAFNGAVSTFKERATLTTPKTANARVNPDQGGAWAPKPKAEVQATIPEGLQVQRGEAYTHDPRYQCAPDERPAGAGFAAEWARLRGALAGSGHAD